jgi:protein TonB
MGYQALLFCPDEKTVRTVTQVLSDLEFTVEACTETFAAVKKLMGQHYDAVVVDCDNEQNATLLFKSARNSTHNQASLAVAVVEGQAGVAKAFRIGANLVLTKPINIEQAKGTLRVARGLLRKGEAPKAAAPATPGTAQTSVPTPAAPKPVAAKLAAPPKPAAPAHTVATPTPAPAAPSWPAKAAVASSAPAAHDAAASDEDLLEINTDEPAEAASVAPPVPAPVSKLAVPVAPPKLAIPVAETKPAFKPLGSPSGAASAPAPAREPERPKTAEISESAAAPTISKAEEPATSSAPVPTFTFGGAAVEKESGGNKKILLIVAAVVILAGAAYGAWSYIQSHPSQPSTPPPASTSSTRTLTSNPAPAKPVAATSTPAPSASAPSTATPTPQTAQTASNKISSSPAVDDSDAESAPSASKNATNSSNSKAPAKTAATPLVVKGGSTPSGHSKSDATDVAAPSMIGMAGATDAAVPNLGSSSNGPKPVLQTVTISQGVSQGLLIKSVAPIYPKTAMTMHIDGDVKLLATISKTGDISNVKVLSGDNRLALAATEAVRQWKYKPYRLDGQPVEIQTTITLKFKSPN